MHSCRPVKPEEVQRIQELLSDLHESFQVCLPAINPVWTHI